MLIFLILRNFADRLFCSLHFGSMSLAHTLPARLNVASSIFSPTLGVHNPPFGSALSGPPPETSWSILSHLLISRPPLSPRVIMAGSLLRCWHGRSPGRGRPLYGQDDAR